MDNINENITMAEARRIIEIVSTLAKGLCFTRLDAMKIGKICEDCMDRIEKQESGYE